MRYQYLFFDLDGTLTDSGRGIMKSVCYALGKMGREIPGQEVLRKFIGPPLSYSFRQFCGMDEKEAAVAVKMYREYFSVTGLFENKVYDGIEEVLGSLGRQGYRLVVATSKPEVYTVRIMEHFRLNKYFELIVGSSLDETRNTKEAVIRYAMERLGISDGKGVMMIGDREHDVQGAKACNLPCIGALWGYGSVSELTDAGAVCLVSKVRQLPEALRGVEATYRP